MLQGNVTIFPALCAPSGDRFSFHFWITGMVRLKVQRMVAASLFVFCGAASAQGGVDASTAEAVARKSGCLKCHSVTAKRDGPSFREVAAKYKGKPDAEKALITHLTTNPRIKVDGKEEMHDNLKTKNQAEIENVVRWILSR